MQLSEAIEQYKEYMQVDRNLSISTLAANKHQLHCLLTFLGDINVEEITAQMVHDYRVFLRRKKKLKSEFEHLVSLRGLLKFCELQDMSVLAFSKVILPKLPERTVTFLKHEEVLALIEAAKGETLSDYRNVALIETLYSTGMRISEALSLNREQIDLDWREFTVRGKGQKTRVVFLSQRAADALKNYLEKRTDTLRPVFINYSSNGEIRGSAGGGLQKRSACCIISAATKKAGIAKKVTCHVLRHPFATNMLANGADIRYIQKFLGHASLETTQIYTHVTDPLLKAIHAKYHDNPTHRNQMSRHLEEVFAAK